MGKCTAERGGGIISDDLMTRLLARTVLSHYHATLGISVYLGRFHFHTSVQFGKQKLALTLNGGTQVQVSKMIISGQNNHYFAMLTLPKAFGKQPDMPAVQYPKATHFSKAGRLVSTHRSCLDSSSDENRRFKLTPKQ